MTKRKPSYEQDRALARGRDVARSNQRRRMADKETAQKEAAALQRRIDGHDHRWRNWFYVLDFTHEVRECRVCGYAQMRQVRL